MDFKIIIRKSIYLFFAWICIFFLNSCSDERKPTVDNTFYFELINFSKDSLKQHISEGLYGKVAFRKDNKLEIISENYLLDDLENIHFLRNAEVLGKEIKTGTKKLSIEFIGDYTIDSITYSIKKYEYSNNQWVNTARLDSVKAITTYQRAKEFAVKEFGKQIINNAVTYTYD